MHIGVIRPKIRVRNEISRFLKFLSSSTSRLAFLDLTPDPSSGRRQLLRAYFRSKKAKREVYELDPPLLGPQPRILGRTIWAVTSVYPKQPKFSDRPKSPHLTCNPKVDPAETRSPNQSNFRKKYEPGSNKNYMVRKGSPNRSGTAHLHSSPLNTSRARAG